MKFKIINGLIYDPSQNFNREKKVIYVKDNKISPRTVFTRRP